MLSICLQRNISRLKLLQNIGTRTLQECHLNRIHKKCVLYWPSRHFSSDEKKPQNTDKKDAENTVRDDTVPVKHRILYVSVCVLTWAFMYFYNQKKIKEKDVIDKFEQLKSVDIGRNDFNLVDLNGKPVSKKTFAGHWLLIYFGFTHCPDICPEELERMTEIVDLIDNDKSIPNIQPVFITIDPRRDSPALMREYLKDFHRKFIGLTGTIEDIKDAAKTYHVYFDSTPRDDDEDYIVDHTIVMYLMSPKGGFVDYYSQSTRDKSEIYDSIKNNMQNFIKLNGPT